MESTLINTAEDLATSKGTPAHAAFLAQLAGTLWRLDKDEQAEAWRATPDESTVARFGLTLADFPGATPPALPVYVAPPPPTPLAQIRALEQKHDDDQRKITRISILKLALDKMCADPAMAGKTRAQVHDLYSAASRGYRELFALEVECARLRKLIV